MPGPRSLTAPQHIVLSWLAAILAFPCALLLAAVGQGLGATLGGCSWIGICLPVNRQVWALVNEPTVAFAHSASATGYWLGSLALPLLVALLVVPLLPRPRSLAAELATVQLAWGSALVGLAVIPLLDPAGGHLARWLQLHGAPPALRWLAPAVGALAALPAASRLLSVDREAVAHPPRWRRMAVVLLHLALPSLLWLVVLSVAGGSVPREAAMAMAGPLLAALLLAWIAVPSRLAHRLQAPTGSSWSWLILLAALMWSVTAVAGRPLPGGGNAALLWGRPLATNNIRDWMQPMDLTRGWNRDPGQPR